MSTKTELHRIQQQDSNSRKREDWNSYGRMIIDTRNKLLYLAAGILVNDGSRAALLSHR